MVLLVIVGTALAVIIPALYIYTCYSTWETHFGGSRLKRSDTLSPSYGNPPKAHSHASTRHQIALRAAAHDHAELSEYSNHRSKANLGDPDGLDPNEGRKERDEMKLNARRTRTMSPKDYGAMDINVSGGDKFRRASLMRYGTKRASKLNMDHQYVSFLSYIWAVMFIGHNGTFLYLTGCTKLKVRDVLRRWGWIEPKPFDASDIVGKLILESTLSVHYEGKRKEGDTEIGGFFFPEFPYVKSDSSFDVADLLSVEVDLKKKRMIWAKLDDVELTPDEAMTLIWYYTISANHVKIHALSNWAINMEPRQIEKNPFPAQNSLVTTMYNYFGFTAFTTFYPGWKKIGLLSKDWNPDSLIDTFNFGIEKSFFAHPLIRELAQYSEFVDFHVKLRPIFMKEFAKVKGKYFPGCHGEALFVGTIIHSLDHTRMDWNLEDPLWLDVTHPEYGKMAELGRIVKVGFVGDLPGLLFHKRYKGSKHPFYDKIYEEAAKLNQKLADHMDTCIVK